MKLTTTFLALILTIGISVIASAQDFNALQKVELKAKEDYKPFEPKALECSNYLLSTPNDDNMNRLIAAKAIINWMSGTPDYTFDIDDSIAKLSEKDNMILVLYMAALTKYVLENPSNAKDAKLVKLNSYKILLNYCENKDNKVKQSKELKKLIEVKKNGKLEEFLNA